MRGRLDHENSLRNAINLGNKGASQRNLNFNVAEFNGVRLGLNGNIEISAEEIVETYEGYLNHLLEVYGYQEGSDEYGVLKSYLFGVKGERVLRDILSLANWGNGAHYGKSSAPLDFDGDLLHVKPKLTLNIARYNNKKEFFYVLFHEMDHMVFFSDITLRRGNRSRDPQQGEAEVLEYLNREDSRFCSEFFARIHTTNLMLINNENKELIMSLGTGETGHSTGDPRYARSMECATIYEQLISIYREGCMDAVKSGERSLGETEPEFWKFYTALNKKLLQCTTEQEIRDILIEACNITPFESSSSQFFAGLFV